MIEPKEVIVKGKKFTISKLPATIGREVLFKYPTSNMPKIGDYATSNEIMLKLMQYVAVEMPDGNLLELKTESLVNNHVESAEMLLLLEKEMFKYNFDFFQNGNASTFLTELERKATEKGIGILTSLLERLSQVAKQPSTN